MSGDDGKLKRQQGQLGVLARGYAGPRVPGAPYGEATAPWFSPRWESLQGEADGRADGRAGVKPLALSLLERFYSAAYRHGYHRGYNEVRSETAS